MAHKPSSTCSTQNHVPKSSQRSKELKNAKHNEPRKGRRVDERGHCGGGHHVRQHPRQGLGRRVPICRRSRCRLVSTAEKLTAGAGVVVDPEGEQRDVPQAAVPPHPALAGEKRWARRERPRRGPDTAVKSAVGRRAERQGGEAAGGGGGYGGHGGGRCWEKQCCCCCRRCWYR